MATLSLFAKLRQAFDKIGYANGTKFPDTWEPKGKMTNAERDTWFAQSKAVFEYAIATELEAAAKKRRENAKAIMLSVNVKCDTTPGEKEMTFSNEFVTLLATRNRNGSTLDRTLLSNNLRKNHNMSEADVEKLLAQSSTVRAGAVTLTAGVVQVE
jgi:hypothetical protein